MARLMLFIDGTWLYSNTPRLAADYGLSDLRLDYGALPTVLGEEVAEQLGLREVDVVRTYLFGSYAENVDPQDHDTARRRQDFYVMLREEFHYEVEVFGIDYRGRRLRRVDRDQEDPFEPREKCVDIALATAMVYYAAIPQAYDIAVVVLGDRDYVPVLQAVRRLGKRVAIASIHGCCAYDYVDPSDAARIRDVDVMWLNDLLSKIELKYERTQRECESPLHVGDRVVWTTYRPRRGRPFYCSDCMRRYEEQLMAQHRATAPEATDAELAHGHGNGADAPNRWLQGRIKFCNGRYGFIQEDAAGGDVYFGALDVEGAEASALMPGDRVMFVEGRNAKGRCARHVRRVAGVVAEPQSAEQPEQSAPTEGVADRPLDAPLQSAPNWQDEAPPSEDVWFGDPAAAPDAPTAR
jgi:cold shock CspA family protein